MKKANSSFEVHFPALATIHLGNRHEQRIFPTHLTECQKIVVDYPVKELLSWHYAETRRQLGKAGVCHLALVTEDFRSGVRLVGIPVDRYDRPLSRRLQVDLRVNINTHELDTTLPQRELDMVPDWLYNQEEQKIKFKFPKDLIERVESDPIQLYLPHSTVAQRLTA